MGLALWVSAVISLSFCFLYLSTVPVLLGFDERVKIYLDISCICYFTPRILHLQHVTAFSIKHASTKRL